MRLVGRFGIQKGNNMRNNWPTGQAPDQVHPESNLELYHTLNSFI